ncbi:IS5 family transposase [Streptomyces lincolnensis]|nr:IS5 family transposase [Streptomyces lincolnensis]
MPTSTQPAPAERAPAGEPDDHALGRSRGGITTEVHSAVDSRYRPLSLLGAAGHRHDSVYFEAVMAGIRVPRIGNGRPRTRPDRVSADRAYSSRAIRIYLRRRGITAVILEPADQIANRKRRGSRGGRRPCFDPHTYKHRNTVEQCINRLKQWRGIAMRTGKLAVHYLAAFTSQRSSSGREPGRKSRHVCHGSASTDAISPAASSPKSRRISSRATSRISPAAIESSSGFSQTNRPPWNALRHHPLSWVSDTSGCSSSASARPPSTRFIVSGSGSSTVPPMTSYMK